MQKNLMPPKGEQEVQENLMPPKGEQEVQENQMPLKGEQEVQCRKTHISYVYRRAGGAEKPHSPKRRAG